MKLEFFTTITNGLPSATVLNTFNIYEGQRVALTMEKIKVKRSHPQNRYYWGVCIPILTEAFIQIGYYWNSVAVSDFIKKAIAKESPGVITEDVVFEMTGEVMQRIKSTSELTKSEFADFITLIQQWAAENLGVTVPNPDEQIKAF
jgi:hypothetical protein